ncbi:MAG TPA: SGNH/GDSL hydrolase family protein [Candidatus Saccharimonadales bacterium]|nr:SGNH/GDSL hydrolase family protein [Candidatus Saccharimonadales bacterium]
MKKLSGVIATLVFSMIFAFLMPVSVGANHLPSHQWAQQVLDMPAEFMVAHDASTYSLLACGNPDAPKTFSTVRDEVEINSWGAYLTPSYYPTFGCLNSTYGANTTSTDGATMYGNYYDGSQTDSKQRIAAWRNGRFIWSAPLLANDGCSSYSGVAASPGGEITTVATGANGITYALVRGAYNNCKTKFMGVDQTGAVLFNHDLGYPVSGNNNSGYGQIWVYDSGVALVDQQYRYRFYSHNGVEDTSKQYQFPVASNQNYAVLERPFANENGRIFIKTEHMTGCYASVQYSPIFWYDPDGTSGTLDLSLGCSQQNKWSLALGHNDNVVLTDTYGTIRLPDMTGGTNHQNHTFSLDSGYDSQRILKYWVNESGDGLLVRRISSSSTSATDIVVDLVDGTTNALTRIKSFKDVAGNNTVTYQSSFDMNLTNDGSVLYALVCQDACTATDRWAYKVPIDGFSGPVGSRTTDYTTPSAKLQYVAMGDSYSSGEGVEAFIVGTDVADVNGCHRSQHAYPKVLAENTAYSSWGLELTDFVACSGATMNDVRGIEEGDSAGSWNEPAQIASLTEDTDVVTLTIGGNDIGFKNYLMACITECGTNSTVYNQTMANILSQTFEDDLEATYTDILEAAPNVEVYVASYPNVTAENAGSCGVFLDFSSARNVQDALNNQIQGAVARVKLNVSGAEKLHYIDANYSTTPFLNRHLCNGTQLEFFNGAVGSPNTEYSVHPNQLGQAAYAEVLYALK